jgi:hypothetical protein
VFRGVGYMGKKVSAENIRSDWNVGIGRYNVYFFIHCLELFFHYGATQWQLSTQILINGLNHHASSYVPM